MNKYKLFSLSIISSIFVYTWYQESEVVLLLPAFGLSLFIYLYSKGLLRSLVGAISSFSLALIIFNDTFGFPTNLVFLPLTMLALEGSFKDVMYLDLDGLKFRSLSTSSVYLLILWISMLFLSSVRFELIIIAFSIPIYLYLKYISFRDDLRKLNIPYKDVYTVIRNKSVEYKLEFSNQSSSIWTLELSSIDEDGYRLYWKPDKLILKPRDKAKVGMHLYGDLIGSYTVSVYVYIQDSTRLFRFSRKIEFELHVKPRLETKLMVARGLLQELAGRGESASDAYYEAIFNKARSGLFLGVRHYTPGDTLRDIHFKKSVEHHTLITKEYEYAGLFKPTLLVDVSTSSYEDLDDVLSDTIDVLMSCIKLGLHNMGLVMYDSSRILIYSINSDPVSLLMKVILYIEILKPSDFKYGYLLDELRLYKTNSVYLSILHKYLVSRLKSSVIGSVLHRLLEEVDKDSRIILVRYGSRFRNLYGLVEYVMANNGYSILDLSRDKSSLFHELPTYMEDLYV